MMSNPVILIGSISPQEEYLYIKAFHEKKQENGKIAGVEAIGKSCSIYQEHMQIQNLWKWDSE